MKDVTIIGAGPGGSTLASLLARAGVDVLLIEKQAFPRFKIGESLLPKGNKVLERSGAWPKIKQAGFPLKLAAEFTYGDGSHRVHNIFSKGMIPNLNYTYQVDRSRFDHILLEHAKESGVEVVQPAQIQSIERKAGEAGWSIRYKNNEAETSQETKFLVDASGRSCTLARHLRLPKKSIQLPNRIAIFSHFTGVPRTSGEFAGDIRIVRIPSGWFWIIPVSETTTSVGLVFCATDKPAGTRAEQFFFEKVAGNALMQKLLQGAQHQMPFKTDSDFSYIHSTFAGDDFLLIGDAAAFLDPVFSSGVYLSLEAANLSADLLQTALRRKSPLTARQQRLYDRRYLTRLKTMESLIRVFYDEEQFPVFMNPRSTLKLAEAVNSVVAGYSILNFPLRWRYELFLWICRMNKSRQIVPPIQL